MKCNKTYLSILGLFLLFFRANSYSQTIDINLTGTSDTTPSFPTYYIGQSYNVTLNPINYSGNVTWEYAGLLDEDSGLEIQLNSGADLPDFIEVNPSNGTAEDLHVLNNVDVLVEDIVSGNYPAELVITDGNENEVTININIQVSRAPVSVAMVLDRSGSMGWPPHGGGSIERMDILKASASLFAQKLDFFSTSADSICLTYFETDIDDPAPAFAQNLTMINGNGNSVSNEIGNLEPGGSTNMGGGLLEAKNKLASTDPNSNHIIFLFTDGEQNQDPLVNNAGTMAGGTSLNDAENSIQIVTIGTGAAAGGDAALRLRAIADQNTGNYAPDTGLYFLLQEEVSGSLENQGNDFNSYTGVADFFNSGFESMLSGGSPQTIDVKKGTLFGRQEKTHEFELNDNINKILFELLTTDQEPDLTIYKGEKEISRNDLIYRYGQNNGANSLLVMLDLDRYNLSHSESPVISEGTWAVKVSSGMGQVKHYQLKTIVDDHKLNYNFKIRSSEFSVGNVLNFSTRLTYDTLRIKDATIEALVLKPGEDLGDLLGRAKINYDPVSSAESGSVGYQKLLAAIEKDTNFVNKLKLGKNVVTLSYTESGEYKGSFSNTGVSGVYQVIFTIRGFHQSAGDFHRFVKRTVYVRFADPDPTISVMDFSIAGDGLIAINYKPMYKVGDKQRLVGPMFAKGIKVEGAGISEEKVIDNGDGSYTITFKGSPTDKIKIKLSEVEVFSGKADGTPDKIDTDGFCNWVANTLKIPCWAAIVIILILFIILARMSRKKKK